MHFRFRNTSTVILLVFLVLTGFAGVPQGRGAEEEGERLLDTIDLSPGVDASQPVAVTLNRSSHKLYVAGRYRGLKVIDTLTRTVTGGIDLGRYTDAAAAFTLFEMAADESAAPAGNKLYVVGNPSGPNAVLRVIDGETDTNVTGEGTDLVLPVLTSGQSSEVYRSMAVNPSNHKVYIANAGGNVVVVDGPNRTVLTTLNTSVGQFPVLVVNPTANKVLVLGSTGGAVIDSATDTFQSISPQITAARSPVFNPANGLVYLGGAIAGQFGVIVLDGITGDVVTLKEIPVPRTLAIAPEQNVLYASGNQEQISAFDATDFSSKPSFPRSAIAMTYDGANGGGLFFLQIHDLADTLRNSVGVLDPGLTTLSRITVAYRPVGVAINNSTNRIYLTDLEAAELLVLDRTSQAVVARQPIEPGASFSQFHLVATGKRDVAISENLNRIYIPRRFGSTSILDVFDGTTNQLRKSITLDDPSGKSPPQITLDDVRRRIYVSAARPAGTLNNIQQTELVVLVYDMDSEMHLATVALGKFGGGTIGMTELAVNPVTGRVYAVYYRSVGIIDGTTMTVVGTVAVEDPYAALAINTGTNKIYVATRESVNTGGKLVVTNRVHVIDGQVGTIKSTFTLPMSADERVNGLAVDEATNTLYGAIWDPIGSGAVMAHDGHQVIGKVALPNAATVVFDGATRQLFVPDDRDGILRVLRPDRWKLLGNISTRGRVGTGDGVMIGGFIVTGPQNSTKQVLVRAIGPSLTELGVPGALGDTTLELHDSAGNVLTNDNWQVDDMTGTSQEAQITATGIPPREQSESAIVATLSPGPCTVIVGGKNGSTGVALVEVYDLDEASPAELVNISTRGNVGVGDDAMIGGVIVRGLGPSRVILRAIGPTLAAAGVDAPLDNPTLELRDGNGALLASSDDWKTNDATGTSQEAEIRATGVPPMDDRESALIATLTPSNYTAIVRGRDDTIGVALVEAYKLE